MKLLKKLVAVVALSAATFASAPAAHAVMGGRVNTHDNVALILLGGSLCTGTVVAPDWVLTARHCVHQGQSLIRINNQNHYPTQAILHPSDDIALLRLNHPTQVAPAVLSDTHLQPGERGEVVGYGSTQGTIATAADATVQRRVHNLPAPLDRVTVIESQVTRGRIVQGDSGGPLFDDAGKLAAVQSGTTQPGTVAFHTPVAEHVNWISRHAGLPAVRVLDAPAPNVDARAFPTLIPAPRVPVIGNTVIESLLNYNFDLRFIPLPALIVGSS
ncbi:trypsin-like serine protease [Corynebacterium felinum]|uniref:S1-C subfamily serine protease n=1 Tax=Corynebacterium felinum TaxID=131318 RepID=A0ABU2B9C0_9CORY|nr:trypsin-like serine protease [Corynebacterium felinum]MDF5821264.1 trypsin-like serine protease [Corynebacterium felinum]MDR7355216.1 S1-C subfamily serine protease [Corynebacterium felinum]WJY94567.1 putative peptidase precursor [Corynebacterium felinum]